MTPLWRTRIVATRAQTGTVIRLLLTGNGIEIIIESMQLMENGFEVKVFTDQIIGRPSIDYPSH